ncbi:MAG: hypothetical protein HY908_24125 [Myxococcales bacterium]|nr:hypothetical protein [Myxococcales bacterium]
MKTSLLASLLLCACARQSTPTPTRPAPEPAPTRAEAEPAPTPTEVGLGPGPTAVELAPGPTAVELAPGPTAVEPDADVCPKGGWPTAVVVDGKYDSGFEATIAWSRSAGAPVLFDVAQKQGVKPPTHWLRIVAGTRGGWTEPRTLEGRVSGVMAAAVDATGLVHVAFTRFDADGGPFLGTIGPGSPWRVEGPLEPGLGFIQDRMSLLLGPAGEVTIAYADHPTRTVKTATRWRGKWRLESVASGQSLMLDHTLVRDRAGRPHVVTQDWASGDLRLYDRAFDGTWSFAVLAKDAHGGSLAIDASDRLHVSFIDWRADELRHAVGPAGGPFATSSVARGKLGNDSSLAVAADGAVRIAYDRRECDDLHLATRAPGAAEWTTELVDAAGDVGTDPSLVLDDRGCVHLAYADGTAWDLKYATKCP